MNNAAVIAKAVAAITAIFLRRRDVQYVIVFGFSYFIVLTLILSSVGETEVSLSVVVSRLQLTTLSDGALGLSNVNELRLQSDDELELEIELGSSRRSSDAATKSCMKRNQNESVRLVGNLSVVASFDSGSVIAIGQDPTDVRSLHFELMSGSMSLDCATRDSLLLYSDGSALPGDETQSAHMFERVDQRSWWIRFNKLKSSTILGLRLGQFTNELDLLAPSRPGLPVGSLSLGEADGGSKRSWIVADGKVVFWDVSNERIVRSGEMLSLEGLRGFQVHQLKIGEGMECLASGVVAEIASISRLTPTSLKPSLFELYRKKNPLVVALVVAVPGFLLLMKLILGITRQSIKSEE